MQSVSAMEQYYRLFWASRGVPCCFTSLPSLQALVYDILPPAFGGSHRKAILGVWSLPPGVGRRESEGSTADTARKRPERPWTAARTMGVLKRCPLAVAQRLVHCAIAVSNAVLGQSHKDNVRCTAVEDNRSERSPSLLMISSGLT